MPIQGLRDSSNFVANQRPLNWREAIMLLYPNGKAPLTALTSLMKSSSTDDPEFNWWEKSLPDQRLQITEALDTSETAIDVASGAKALKDGHLLRVEQTGEILLVNGDPATDVLINVVRAYSGTSATAIANISAAGVNPYCHVIGSAHEEGSLAPTGISYDPTKVRNYTQIFRNTLEMTRTGSKTRLRTGDQVKEAKRECLELHSIEMEKALILGKPLETTRNAKPIRTTGGIIHFIAAANIISHNAAVKMTDLEGWLKTVFAVGASEKVGFCGNTAMLAVNQAVRKNGEMNLQPGLKEYGMNVMRLTCPFGELVLKTHPLFNQVVGGTTGGSPYYGMDSWLLIIDQTELKYRPFTDTKYEKDLQQNGMDGMKSGYLTEAGLEIHHPTSHMLIKGMASGVVDS